MSEPRVRYHDELRRVEAHVQSMGAAAQDLFAKAVRAVCEDDIALGERVIIGDDVIDEYYLRTEERILNLFALQTPVASDLRLLTVLLHINIHLERIGDMAVNLAKIGKLASGLPRSATVIAHLDEMGTVALRMIGASMEAFSRRNLELARTLPDMDEPIDRLNRGMLQEVLEIADERNMLEWGIRMHVVSRQIERTGDHAVDIAEQVAFLLTGVFKEFTDASHPEVTAHDS
ncbi:MAG TPA: phosphate signaling complex protein PhoU [Actinomycetota bacterium]|nr:phosphate signaling complex protein PhoU [Actinomycetota bacterium]